MLINRSAPLPRPAAAGGSSMLTRRGFLGSVTIPAGTLAATGGLGLLTAAGHAAPQHELLDELAQTPGEPEAIAKDENFWARVQQAFTIDRSVINFNNGGVSPSPAIVQEALKRHLEYANQSPSTRALWAELEPQKEGIRQRLAREWGVSSEEIALTRNASESLQICQLGFDLQPGDEVLTTTVDYPRMLTTFKQRERRDGIVLKQIKLPIPCEDNPTLVRLFEQNITSKTRLILMSHIVNITGQIMPVKAIVAMARTKNGGIPVIVDGAHAMAQIDFKLSDLECDYYGVSLHKWLAAPHGTGLLYVRKDKIKALWPMMAADVKQEDDIRKFEEIGTHPAGPLLAVGEALTFHQAIGGKRKEARLRYLRDRWATRLKPHDRVKLHTSLNPAFSCAIGTVQIEGIDSAKLYGWLWRGKNSPLILTTPIKHDEFEGIRVTPSVYTTLEEVDRFSEAMEKVLKEGLPE